MVGCGHGDKSILEYLDPPPLLCLLVGLSPTRTPVGRGDGGQGVLERPVGKRKQLSVRTRFEVFKRDDFTCRYCGRKSPDVVLEIDHIIPVADNGSNDEMNLVTSCFECNSGKSDKPLGQMVTGEDPHDKAIELWERERQLREYNEVQERVRKRIQAEIIWLNEKHTLYQGEESYVRAMLKHGSVYDVDEAFAIADERVGDRYPARIKYVCGIMRNKRREDGEN